MWEVNRACGRLIGHLGGQLGTSEVNRACRRSIAIVHVGGQQAMWEVNRAGGKLIRHVGGQ